MNLLEGLVSSIGGKTYNVSVENDANRLSSLVNRFPSTYLHLIEPSAPCKLVKQARFRLSRFFDFGCTEQAVKKRFGAAYMSDSCGGDLGFSVLLYKQKISSCRIRLEFHFFKNSLFYYRIKTSESSCRNTEILQNFLAGKFNLINGDIFENNGFYQDISGRAIHVNHDVTFKIEHYVLKHALIRSLELKKLD